MATKKITLTELKSLVKKIIKEENDLNPNSQKKSRQKTTFENEGFKMTNIEEQQHGITTKFIVTFKNKDGYRIEIPFIPQDLDDESFYNLDENGNIIEINEMEIVNGLKSATYSHQFVTKDDEYEIASRIAHWLAKKYNVNLK
jgi:hypothetical protein